MPTGLRDRAETERFPT